MYTHVDILRGLAMTASVSLYSVGYNLEAQVLSLMGTVGNIYRYMQDLLALAAYQSTPSSLHCRPGPSPLDLGSLQLHLNRHPDPQFASYVFRGL